MLLLVLFLFVVSCLIYLFVVLELVRTECEDEYQNTYDNEQKTNTKPSQAKPSKPSQAIKKSILFSLTKLRLWGSYSNSLAMGGYRREGGVTSGHGVSVYVYVCVSLSFVTCGCRPVAAISNGATNHFFQNENIIFSYLLVRVTLEIIALNPYARTLIVVDVIVVNLFN